MSPQSLRQVNGEYNGSGPHCRFENDQMERLIKSIESNTTATSNSNENYKHMTKYLLYVVCIIALGQKLLETIKDVWGEQKVYAVEGKQ